MTWYSAQFARRTPNRKRITIALDIAGLYGPEVDRALGGEEPMVDEWEAGIRVPTFAQVEALAALAVYPVGFFYMPDPEPSIGIICVRSGPGKGCTVVDERPSAPVVELRPTGPRQGVLWS